MGAGFHKTAAVEDEDDVGVADGGGKKQGTGVWKCDCMARFMNLPDSVAKNTLDDIAIIVYSV